MYTYQKDLLLVVLSLQALENTSCLRVRSANRRPFFLQRPHVPRWSIQRGSIAIWSQHVVVCAWSWAACRAYVILQVLVVVRVGIVVVFVKLRQVFRQRIAKTFH